MRSEQLSKFRQDLIKAKKELEKLGNFWAGPDIEIEKPTIIDSETSLVGVNLILNKDCFPPVSELTTDTFHWLGRSVRSCFAQAGIEIGFSADGLSPDTINQIVKGKEAPVPVTVTNHGLRPIELNNRILRFFWVNFNNRIRGNNLEKIISSQLRIKGKYGKEWSFVNNDGQVLNKKGSKNSKATAIRFYLTNKKLYIPESSQTLRVSSKKDLEKVIRPIPNNLNPLFQVRETAEIDFGKDIVGIINTGTHDGGARHAMSPLIDPGSKGAIRAELIGHTHPEFIEVLIYKG